MKSVLIIGLGTFGRHLCRELTSLGNQVMVIDKNENNISDLINEVTTAKVGDCTNEVVLKSLGIANFDVCFVCIGTSFQDSLEITYALKELGAKWVVSKADREVHAKFLLRNGADEIIYPEKDIAERVAKKFSVKHAVDYIDIPGNLCIYEHEVPSSWVGRDISDINARAVYNINVLAVRKPDKTDFLLTADYVFKEEDNLITLGDEELMNKLLKNDFARPREK